MARRLKPSERVPPSEWSWFPHQGDLALIGTEGFASPVGGRMKPKVAFTIVENYPPFRELRHLRPVSLMEAPYVRERVVAQLRRGIVPRPHRATRQKEATA